MQTQWAMQASVLRQPNRSVLNGNESGLAQMKNLLQESVCLSVQALLAALFTAKVKKHTDAAHAVVVLQSNLMDIVEQLQEPQHRQSRHQVGALRVVTQPQHGTEHHAQNAQKACKWSRPMAHKAAGVTVDSRRLLQVLVAVLRQVQLRPHVLGVQVFLAQAK
jgi:hypothetical protein